MNAAPDSALRRVSSIAQIAHQNHHIASTHSAITISHGCHATGISRSVLRQCIKFRLKMDRQYSNRMAILSFQLLGFPHHLESMVSRPSDGIPNQAQPGDFLAVMQRKDRGCSWHLARFGFPARRPTAKVGPWMRLNIVYIVKLSEWNNRDIRK